MLLPVVRRPAGRKPPGGQPRKAEGLNAAVSFSQIAGRGQGQGGESGEASLRVVVNVLIVAIELALILAVAALAWAAPVLFAGLTFALALALGLRLEVARLEHEMPFYFERSGSFRRAVRLLVGSGEALVKAVLAAAIGLVVFSGTDSSRLMVMAAIFAVLVLIGSMLLRRGTLSLGMRPARWGFFRMAAPLGILYSVALSPFPAPRLADIAWRAIFELPRRPSLAQLGETLFNVRLWADDLIVRLLAQWLGADGARVAGLLMSSNVLAGFVIAVYAVLVSEVVRQLEERAWAGRP